MCPNHEWRSVRAELTSSFRSRPADLGRALAAVKAGVPKNFWRPLEIVQKRLLTHWPGGPFGRPSFVISVVVASKGGWLWRHSISHPFSGRAIGFDQLPGLLSHALGRDETGYPALQHRESAARISTASSWRWPASPRTTSRSSCEHNRLSVRGKMKDRTVHDLSASRHRQPRVRAPVRPRRLRRGDRRDDGRRPAGD